MKIKSISFFLVVISLFSCEYDYNIEFDKEFSPKVVLNSVITPDSTIKASILWSQHISEDGQYNYVERFSATLYEDEKVIFEGDCEDGKITTNIKPKEGAKYRIELDVPDYGIVKAETIIPHSPQINIEYVGVTGNENIYYKSYQHFVITKILVNKPYRSIMIRALGMYENYLSQYSSTLYANNPYCDQFNTVNDNYDAALKGSVIGHEYYIRTPYKNIQFSMPLAFSISNFETYLKDVIIGYDEFGFPIYESVEYPPTHIMVEVIAPSDEYDKYYKSAYQQIKLNFDDIPIFNQVYPIHSNIENGLGIFAGYSSANFILKLENNEN